MKIRIFFLVLSILTNTFRLNAQVNKNNLWTDGNLKGKVKSINESTYKAFIKSGQVTKKKLIFSCLILCDSIGYLIKYCSGFKHKQYKYFQTFGYDEKGNMIKMCDEQDNCPLYKWTYKYDDRGKLIEEINFNEKDSLIGKNVYTYNDTNDLIAESRLIRNGNKWHLQYSYIFNNKGQLIEKKDNNCAEGTCIIWKYLYKYDDNGNKIEESNYSSDSLRYINKYKYDLNRNRIEICRYEPNGSISSETSYNYDYDKYNNWVKRIIYQDKKIESVTERQIEYY